MPVYPRTRPRPQRCVWEGCRRNGAGNPPLCAEHDDVDDDNVLDVEELVDTVLEHPRVRQATDRVYGLLDQLAGFVDQLKRGDYPRARPSPTSPSPPDVLARARTILHFAPTEALTEDKVRERKHALARMVHPDVGGSQEAMQNINRAADVLMKSLKPA